MVNIPWFTGGFYTSQVVGPLPEWLLRWEKVVDHWHQCGSSWRTSAAQVFKCLWRLEMAVMSCKVSMNIWKKNILNRQLKDLEKWNQGFFEILRKKKPKASNTEFKSLLLHSSEVFFHTKKNGKISLKKKGPPDTMGATSSTEAISAPIGVEGFSANGPKKPGIFLGGFKWYPPWN